MTSVAQPWPADPMVGLLALWCLILGLVIGSFLNVVIWRVPRGESVVSPPSACPQCGNGIRARDNVPVLGWLMLRGRCRDCSNPISARYPVVELGTGLLFGATAWWLGPVWHLPAFLYLGAIAVSLALIDLDVRRLPDAIVLPSYGVAAVLLLGAALLEGRGLGACLQILGSGLTLFLLYFVIWFVKPGGMGLGDVKLAGVLGMYLGWLGWRALAVGAFAAFLIGGVVGIGFLAAGLGRKYRMPFGPYMLIGAYLGLLFGVPVTTWYLTLAGLK